MINLGRKNNDKRRNNLVLILNSPEIQQIIMCTFNFKIKYVKLSKSFYDFQVNSIFNVLCMSKNQGKLQRQWNYILRNCNKLVITNTLIHIIMSTKLLNKHNLKIYTFCYISTAMAVAIKYALLLINPGHWNPQNCFIYSIVTNLPNMENNHLFVNLIRIAPQSS